MNVWMVVLVVANVGIGTRAVFAVLGRVFGPPPRQETDQPALPIADVPARPLLGDYLRKPPR